LGGFWAFVGVKLPPDNTDTWFEGTEWMTYKQDKAANPYRHPWSRPEPH
jgi:hypothetical protein